MSEKERLEIERYVRDMYPETELEAKPEAKHPLDRVKYDPRIVYAWDVNRETFESLKEVRSFILRGEKSESGEF